MSPYPDGSLAPIRVVKRDGSSLPLFAYGDGVQRWFYILGTMELYKNAIVCMDGIDAGFQPDLQNECNKSLAQFARNHNVQLFITTQNIEYVDHFLDAVNELGDDFAEEARVITLREIDNAMRYRVLKAKEAWKARQDYGVDLI